MNPEPLHSAFPLLSLLIWLPILGGLATLAFGNERANAARWFATSRQGRLAKASREDHLAARAMGNNPAVQQMYALLLSVAVVAVGSVLRVYSLGSITPKFFFFEYTLLTLTMPSSPASALTGDDAVRVQANSKIEQNRIMRAVMFIPPPGCGWRVSASAASMERNAARLKCRMASISIARRYGARGAASAPPVSRLFDCDIADASP